MYAYDTGFPVESLPPVSAPLALGPSPWRHRVTCFSHTDLQIVTSVSKELAALPLSLTLGLGSAARLFSPVG